MLQEAGKAVVVQAVQAVLRAEEQEAPQIPLTQCCNLEGLEEVLTTRSLTRCLLP